jgi:hypothetical protein
MSFSSWRDRRELAVVAIRGLDRLDAVAEQIRHRLPQLQIARLFGERDPGQRDDHAQRETLAGRCVHCAIAAPHARLAHHLRARQFRYQPRYIGARAGDHSSTRSHEHRFLHACLLAQTVEQHHLLRGRAIGELVRHGPALDLQVIEHLVDRRLTEELCAFERRIDLDVEPRFDAAGEKLHRHEVHQRAGRKRHQPEHHQQAQPQAGAELALAIAAHQQHELPDHQRREQCRERGVEAEKQRVMARKERRIGTRRREQEQQHARERRADQQQHPHLGSASFGSRVSAGAGAAPAAGDGRKVKRRHDDSRFISRLVRALNWNGFGKSVVSSRMRSAAS